MKRIELDCKRSSWSCLIKLQSKSIFILTNKKGVIYQDIKFNNFTICNGDIYQIGGIS